MPGYNLAGIPVLPSAVDIVSELQHLQASTGQIKAQTALTQAETVLKGVMTQMTEKRSKLLDQQIQMDDAFMQAQISANNAQMESNVRRDPSLGGTTDPTKNESAPSIASMDYDASSPVQKELLGLTKERQRAQADYDITNAYTLSPAAQKVIKEKRAHLDDLNTRIGDLTKKALDEQRENAREVSNGASSVHDQDSLLAWLGDVAQRYGPQQAMKIARQLPKDEAGVPVWNGETLKRLTPIQKRFESAHEQTTDSINAQRLAREQQRDADEQSHRLFEEKAKTREIGQKDSELSLRREGMQLREKTLANTLDFRAEATLSRIEQQEQHRLDQTYGVKEWGKLQQDYDTVRNTLDNYKQYGFRKGVTEVEVDNAIKAYQLMANHYRALGGYGKWTDQQKGQFDSKIARVESYFRTLGTGYKSTPHTIEEIAAEVKRMYVGQQAQVMKDTLRIRDNVWTKYGDPNAIDSPASPRTLIDAGVAREAVKDGKRYLIFDADKEVYPIHDEAKKRKQASPFALDDGEE